jgi:hypothetical protein
MGFLEDYVGFEQSPGYAQRINTIIDFWSDPCQAPWHVYMETLLPVAGRLAITLIDTDLLDMLRAYTKPRRGLARGRNRTKGRRRNKFIGIPESSEFLAQFIYGQAWFSGRDIGNAQKWIWRIDGVTQRLLWWWLVVDLTVDGFYWWAMLMRQSEYCKRENVPALYATTDMMGCLAFAGAWLNAGTFTETIGGQGVTINQSSVTFPEGRWQCTVSGEFNSSVDNESQICMRWSHPVGNEGECANLPGRGSATLSVTRRYLGPGSVTAQTKYTGALFCDGGPGQIIVKAV